MQEFLREKQGVYKKNVEDSSQKLGQAQGVHAELEKKLRAVEDQAQHLRSG